MDQQTSLRRSFATDAGRSGRDEQTQFQPALCRGYRRDAGARHRAVEGGGGAAAVVGVTAAGEAHLAALRLRLGRNHASQLPARVAGNAERLPREIQLLKFAGA